jgi:hypothetical protein
MMKQALPIAMVMAALVFILWMDSRAKAARVIPDKPMRTPPCVHVDSQKDIYAIYKHDGLWGVRVVHLNRFLNLVESFPKEESISMPFPVRVKDVRTLYEKGLDAHSWLFIANRTGLVRSVTVVLPEPVFQERLDRFKSEAAFSVSGGLIRGYTYDMPMMVTTLDTMPVVNEPVIVNIDAGYFGFSEEPDQVIAKLRRKCPDIRRIVASGSIDEPEIDDGARKRLKEFERTWTTGK